VLDGLEGHRQRVRAVAHPAVEFERVVDDVRGHVAARGPRHRVAAGGAVDEHRVVGLAEHVPNAGGKRARRTLERRGTDPDQRDGEIVAPGVGDERRGGLRVGVSESHGSHGTA